MKNLIIAILVFLFPCAAFAQEKENLYFVSPEYAKILENCCTTKKEEKEAPLLGEIKTSSDELISRILKKRKLRLYATNTLHYKEEWSFKVRRSHDNYFFGIGYETNRDPITLLFDPLFTPFASPHHH